MYTLLHGIRLVVALIVHKCVYFCILYIGLVFPELMSRQVTDVFVCSSNCIAVSFSFKIMFLNCVFFSAQVVVNIKTMRERTAAAPPCEGTGHCQEEVSL